MTSQYTTGGDCRIVQELLNLNIPLDQIVAALTSAGIIIDSTTPIQVEVVAGASSTAIPGMATAVLTQTSLATSSFTILTANSNRKAFILTNASTETCYIAFAATATTSAYTIALAGGAGYEAPFPCYTGTITGIASVASGQIQATEMSI